MLIVYLLLMGAESKGEVSIAGGMGFYTPDDFVFTAVGGDAETSLSPVLLLESGRVFKKYVGLGLGAGIIKTTVKGTIGKVEYLTLPLYGYAKAQLPLSGLLPYLRFDFGLPYFFTTWSPGIGTDQKEHLNGGGLCARIVAGVILGKGAVKLHLITGYTAYTFTLEVTYSGIINYTITQDAGLSGFEIMGGVTFTP